MKIAASYPDLPAHTQIFTRNYFLSHQKAGRSGRLGDVTWTWFGGMSGMWTILHFLAVSSPIRGMQNLEKGLAGSCLSRLNGSQKAWRLLKAVHTKNGMSTFETYKGQVTSLSMFWVSFGIAWNLRTSVKLELAHIPNIVPNHVQVTSSLHHPIDQTFRFSVW